MKKRTIGCSAAHLGKILGYDGLELTSRHTLNLLPYLLVLLMCWSSVSQSEETFKSLSDIEQALNPLEVVANHGGIRRSIDLDIAFALNSDQLLPQALSQLKTLGDAMNSDRLADYQFQVVGHTDAKGSADYNLRLSEQRAHSAANYLIESMNVASERLQILGKGETQLKDKLAPDSAKHRRVEIIAIPVSDTDKASNKQLKVDKLEMPKQPTKKSDGTLEIDW